MSTRIAVLCSGGGSNLQAIIDAVEAGKIDGEIVLVIANASKAYALERARNHGIPAMFISKKQAGSTEAFNDEILRQLQAVNAELVVLVSEEVDGEEFLASIDSDEEYERVGSIFLERLAEYDEEEDEE